MTGLPLRIPALREQILEQMLRWSAIVSLVPCVAGVALAVRFEIWPVVLLDTLSWLLLLALFLHRRLAYAYRAGGFVLLLGGAGAGILVALGPFGVGLVWLLGVPAVAGVLFGQRVFWLAEAAVLAIVLAVASGEALGLLQWSDLPAPLAWWIMAAFSVLSVSLLVGLSTTAMMSRLTGALREVEQANEALQREMASRAQAEAERARLQEQVMFAQKMELVGQLAGGVAHDLNNLLTVVRVEGDIARDEVPEPSELAEGLDSLIDATKTASALCQRLLLFARPSSGNRGLIELDRRIEAALPLLRSLAGGQVRVETDLDAPDAVGLVDPVEIEQILTNLVANARDAMPDGGTVTLRSRVRDDGAGGFYQLEVEDAGIGMDDATARRVFEPFFTTKEGRGTGLGLATVYSLVRSLDGTIHVRSTEGLGTTFSLRLPLATPSDHQGELDLPRARHRLPPPGASVLVVEDNPSVRQVVVRVLEAVGCVVVDEPDVARALATVAELPHPLDLVVTDVLMPGRTGVDLAEEVGRRCPTTRILAMTGWIGDRKLAVRLEQLGVPVLRKPFSPAELVDAVTERLVEHAASQ